MLAYGEKLWEKTRIGNRRVLASLLMILLGLMIYSSDSGEQTMAANPEALKQSDWWQTVQLASPTPSSISLPTLTPHFTPVPETGVFHTIIVNQLDGFAVEVGADEIGIFDEDLCVGALIIDHIPTPSDPISVTAWIGYDPPGPEPPLLGAREGYPVMFRVWDNSAGIEYPDNEIVKTLIYGPEAFTNGGLSVFELTVTPAPTPTPTPTATPTPLVLTVGDSSGCPGATNVPVEVSLDNTVNVKAVQLILCDIPDLLILGIQAPEADPTRASGFTVDASETGGCVEVYMVSLTGDLIAPGSGRIFTLYYDVDPAATVCNGIDMQLTYYNISDENSNPLPVIPENGSFKVGVKGDLDGDCDCNLFDVLRQIDIVLSKPPDPTPCELWAGDMDDDGNIDLFDVLALIDCILGRSSCACAG